MCKNVKKVINVMNLSDRDMIILFEIFEISINVNVIDKIINVEFKLGWINMKKNGIIVYIMILFVGMMFFVKENFLCWYWLSIEVNRRIKIIFINFVGWIFNILKFIYFCELFLYVLKKWMIMRRKIVFINNLSVNCLSSL